MLKLQVITPDKVITDEVVDSISLPTTSGMITVLDVLEFFWQLTLDIL